MCPFCYQKGGSLLHCLSTLTCTLYRRFISVALALESPPPDVIRHPALRSPDFPRLRPFGACSRDCLSYLTLFFIILCLTLNVKHLSFCLNLSDSASIFCCTRFVKKPVKHFIGSPEMHREHIFRVCMTHKIVQSPDILLTQTEIRRHKCNIDRLIRKLSNRLLIIRSHLLVIRLWFSFPVPPVQISCVINHDSLIFYPECDSFICRWQCTHPDAIHTPLFFGRQPDYLFLFIRHRHIIRKKIPDVLSLTAQFQNVRIIMIIMYMTHKYKQCFFRIHFGETALIIIKQKQGILHLQKKSTVSEICHPHHTFNISIARFNSGRINSSASFASLASPGRFTISVFLHTPAALQSRTAC